MYHCFVASFVFPTVLSATTIFGVSPTQTDPNNAYILSGNVDDFSWTSSVGYAHVNISVDLSMTTSSAAAWSLGGMAYLTNAIGPAASVANVLFSNPFTLSDNPGTIGAFGPYATLLFQNLTLAAGTYNLVLTAAGDSQHTVGLEESDFLDPLFTVTTGPGISGVRDRYAIAGGGVRNLNFPPGSTFIDQSFVNYNVSVVGDPTPEPGTFLFLAGGILLLGWLFRNGGRDRDGHEALARSGDTGAA